MITDFHNLLSIFYALPTEDNNLCNLCAMALPNDQAHFLLKWDRKKRQKFNRTSKNSQNRSANFSDRETKINM